MKPSRPASPDLLDRLDLIRVELDGPIASIRLNRPAKRNALSDPLVAQLHTCVVNLPATVRAIVLSGEGDHFCAGLDLSELSEHSVAGGIEHSRSWHVLFDLLQFGRAPVIAVLNGAVVGGGLELASTAHIRVAEDSTIYGLPEGQRGIFVGGSGSVRVPRLIGYSRMTDLMLTGRVLDADEGQQIGLSHYRVANGQGMAKAFELAKKIASNAPMSNFAVMHALPRIADMSHSEGLFVESLMAAIAQAEPVAKERMRAFVEGKAAKVRKA